MSRLASRITPDREALLRFFALGQNTQVALRDHMRITSILATARIGNAINACELRRVRPTAPGAPLTPAIYEITDKGRATLNAIDNPADTPAVKPTHAKKLKAGSTQTPREMAVGVEAERRHETNHALFASELLEKLVKAAAKGAAPHQPRVPRVRPMIKAPPPMPMAMGRDPCPRCGTRGDLGCKHLRAAASPVDAFEPPVDGREQSAGRSGHHLRKMPASIGSIAHG